VDETQWLAERFEEHRRHLRAVAYRILGSGWEADDALQETWLRLSRADASGIENLRAWLTTIVARVSLNMLSARNSRPEDAAGVRPPGTVAVADETNDPEYQALLADSVGLALLVVLDSLTPAERLAFVLHDMFDVPFDEIGPIIERSPVAARQLASRARRRVRGAVPPAGADPIRQRETVAAFLAASRGGAFEALVALLDPEVVLRADDAAVRMGAAREVRGAVAAARAFMERYRGVRATLINGAAGAVWAPRAQPRVVFLFAIKSGRVTAIELVAEPERLRQLTLEFLD
jgi:RNA polymerase sigma factor (sigma-70 family)